MPGYVMHLAACEEIFRKCNITDEEFKAGFIVGSIIPDTKERALKKDTHFWPASIMDKLMRKPDISAFLEQYGNKLTEPYVLGYYAHLKLDRNYMDNYWLKHFRFFNDSGDAEELYDKVTKVLVTDSGMMYDRERFFSDELYYGDYDKANEYVVNRYNISYGECSGALELVLSDRSYDRYNIGGLKVTDCALRLRHMIEYLRADMRTDSDRKSLELPELNVLDMKDIQEMISGLADEIAGFDLMR